MTEEQFHSMCVSRCKYWTWIVLLTIFYMMIVSYGLVVMYVLCSTHLETSVTIGFIAFVMSVCFLVKGLVLLEIPFLGLVIQLPDGPGIPVGIPFVSLSSLLSLFGSIMVLICSPSLNTPLLICCAYTPVCGWCIVFLLYALYECLYCFGQCTRVDYAEIV